MSGKPRRHYTAQDTVAILREHLLEGKPVSEVCRGRQLQPTAFHGWQKTFFENGAAPTSALFGCCFEPRKARRTRNGSRAGGKTGDLINRSFPFFFFVFFVPFVVPLCFISLGSQRRRSFVTSS